MGSDKVCPAYYTWDWKGLPPLHEMAKTVLECHSSRVWQHYTREDSYAAVVGAETKEEARQAVIESWLYDQQGIGLSDYAEMLRDEEGLTEDQILAAIEDMVKDEDIVPWSDD